MKKMEVFGLQTIGEIQTGDELPAMIVKAIGDELGGVEDKDIIVMTSKIISKAMGLVKKKSDVNVSKKALAVSKRTGKDPVWVQMIMDEGHKVLAVIPLGGMFRSHVLDASGDHGRSNKLCDYEQCVFITLSPEGQLHTCDAGIDGSNHAEGMVSSMPPNADEAAEAVREEIMAQTGKEVAVIIADTELMPFGTMDFAIGSSGIEPRSKEFGMDDSFGKPKFGGMDLTAYELTSAAALLFGQVNAGIPVAIVRGYDYNISNTENIGNTIWGQARSGKTRKTISEILNVTAGAHGIRRRILLKIISWFI